ncbi:MAG: hypothetical protein IJ870_03315 [Alphaproteobacteria bacterium]|nr:hypothetical protein [Alphaproteobacteria bacterium]
MALNNYSAFYQKLTSKIVLVFCLFFIATLNIMRFYQLVEASKTTPDEQKKPSDFVYTLYFGNLENKSDVKMVVLSPYFNQKYLSFIFQPIMKEKLFLVNCLNKDIQQLNSFLSGRFPQTFVQQKPCDISPDEVEQILKKDDSLVVFLSSSQSLFHPCALSAAQHLQLQPDIKLTEIKMVINGYELNLSQEELEDIVSHQMRQIELISPDFEGYQTLPEGDKKALIHLVNAARLINDVALEQDHPLNLAFKKAFENLKNPSKTEQNAYTLFQSLNGVAGLNGLNPKPVEIFKGVHQTPGKNFYPADLNKEEFHQILLKMFERGKTDEIKKILSGRTMVRRKADELYAIDYTEYFKEIFSLIANELEVAAHYTTEHEFEHFLSWQAQALLQNNEEMDMLADKHWAKLQFNHLEFTISRENYEDELTGTVFENPRLKQLIEEHKIDVNAKDTLGCRVGIVNQKGTDLILKSKDTMHYIAQKMPFNEQYTQKIEKDTKQTMVDVDLMALTGDYAMCRGGITIAQNLQNDDKLSVKMGYGRRNVYHRQVRFYEDEERTKKMLDALVGPELHQYYKKETDHYFVIGHENGHSLGPDSSYKNALGIYTHTIEEHKANMVSVAFMADVAHKFGIYTEQELKQIYTTWIIRLFLKSKPVLSKPHRMADLIEFNYLKEHGVISFDSENKLHINFDKITEVSYRLLSDTISVQLSKSPDVAKAFIDRWSYWSEISEYIAGVQKQLGIRPYIKLITKF